MPTTVTVRVAPSGGDYTSLSAAEAGEQRDLVALDELALIECEAFVDDAFTVDFNGWTVDATRFITVQAAAGHEHNGIIGQGYRGGSTGSSMNYTVFKGLTILNPTAASFCFTFTGTNITIDSCIAAPPHSATAIAGIVLNNTSNGSVIQNNLVVFDFTGGTPVIAYGIDASDAENVTIENNTVINKSDLTAIEGIRSSVTPTQTWTNNVAYGFTTDFDLNDLNTTLANNASSDTTGQIQSIGTAAFVDYAGGDYQIDDTSALYNAGVDLSGSFSNDIRGTLREAASWDIGAYKFDIKTVLVSFSGGGDYSELNTAEAGEQRNLPSFAEKLVFEIRSGIYVDQTFVSGYSSNSLFNVTIRPESGSEHGGVFGAGVHFQSPFGTGLILSDEYSTVEGLTIECTEAGVGDEALNLNGRFCVAKNCFIRNASSSIEAIDLAGNCSVINCVIENTGHDSSNDEIIDLLSGANFAEPALIKNSTIIGTGNGTVIDTSTTEACTLVNCAIAGFTELSGDADYGDIKTQNCVMTFAAPTEPGYSSLGGDVYSANPTAMFEDYAGGDYKPKGSGPLAGAGADLSVSFTDDITGATRTFWSIGAWDAPFGAPPVTYELTLTADGITFDPKASIHVQWMGTGTLLWINNNGSNASIASTPNGGTVLFVTPATLTVTGLQAGSEVRVYEAGTTNELAGTESSGTSYATSLQANSVDVRIIDLDYQIKAVKAVDMTGGDVTLVAGQLFDRQYENP